jgi:L-alanine-DL-glutamate epimerase-like enolase superfamily enzyme
LGEDISLQHGGAVADVNKLVVSPHFMTNLHIQLAGAVPRAVYVKYYTFMDDLLENGLETVDGAVLVPDRPGHGLSFRPEAWQRHGMR